MTARNWFVVVVVLALLWRVPGFRWRLKVGCTAVLAAAVCVIAVNPTILNGLPGP